MIRTTSQAPSVNLLTSSMASAAVVSTAPSPLMNARRAQPSPCCSCQCLTMPVWDRVNPTNTPMANTGIRAWVLPLDTTSSTAAAAASTPTPYRKTCRSPFSANTCGRKLSLPSRLARTGRPPKEVLAARASRTVVMSCTA